MKKINGKKSTSRKYKSKKIFDRILIEGQLDVCLYEYFWDMEGHTMEGDL